MKKSLLAVALATLAAQPSHAIFGLGGTYGLNFTTISSAADVVGTAELPTYLREYNDGGAGQLTIVREGVSGLQQIGLKTWIDLPLIPIEFEGAANVAWGSYKSAVQFTDPLDPANNLEITTGVDVPSFVPGVKSGETPYIASILDASIRYPFLKLPPMSPLKPFKIYAGGGVSWFYSSKVISKDDVKDMFDVSGGAAADLTPQKAQAALAKKIEDNFYESSFGGHILLGMQLKVPVVPLAIFADGKWYFNAATSSAATTNPFAVTAGLALAL